MTGYVPPALRKNQNYNPKIFSLKPKPIDYTQLKTKEMLMNEYQKENEGKADDAWNSIES